MAAGRGQKQVPGRAGPLFSLFEIARPIECLVDHAAFQKALAARDEIVSLAPATCRPKKVVKNGTIWDEEVWCVCLAESAAVARSHTGNRIVLNPWLILVRSNGYALYCRVYICRTIALLFGKLLNG